MSAKSVVVSFSRKTVYVRIGFVYGLAIFATINFYSSKMLVIFKRLLFRKKMLKILLKRLYIVAFSEIPDFREVLPCYGTILTL